MVGAIIGDIVGSVYEFDNIFTKRFPFFPRYGSYSDDTVLTIAVFKALKDSKTLFEELPQNMQQQLLKDTPYRYYDLANCTVNRLKEYGKNYPHAGYGMLFDQWLQQENPTPYNSWGNGAAMRISAVAYFAKSLEELKYLSYNVTAVTHNHPNAILGAEAAAAAIFLALQGKSKQQIKEHIEKNYYSLDFDYKTLQQTYNPLASQHKISHMGCKNTVPQAIYCFLISNSFEDAIRTGVSIGGDSDTLCAIIGSIAEAYYCLPDKFKECGLSYLDAQLASDVNQFEQFVAEQNVNSHSNAGKQNF